MTFDVRITFTGLCLYVPDTRGAMHVLMPVTGTAPMIPQHDAVLVYDAAYLKGEDDTVCILKCFDLAKGYLSLGDPDGEIAIHQPPEIAKLHEHVLKRFIELDDLGPNPQHTVFSRVTLHSGRFSGVSRCAKLEFTGKKMPMAWQLEWTINDMPGKHFPIHLRPFTYEGETKPAAKPHEVKLKPINGTVRFGIMHVPHGAHGENAVLGEQAHHFAALYDLFRHWPRRKRPVPVAPSVEIPDPVPCTTLSPDQQANFRMQDIGGTVPPPPTKRGDPYTCMGGGGCPNGQC